MDNNQPRYSAWDLSSDINWEEIPSGEILRKFTAVDESQKGIQGGDYTVEVHGVFDEEGRLYITKTIVRPAQQEAKA